MTQFKDLDFKTPDDIRKGFERLAKHIDKKLQALETAVVDNRMVTESHLAKQVKAVEKNLSSSSENRFKFLDKSIQESRGAIEKWVNKSS